MTTDNFLIRSFDPRDAGDLYLLSIGQKEPLLTTTFWRTWSLFDFENYIKTAITNESYKLCISAKLKGEFITVGSVELNQISWIHGRAELGIFILSSQHKGKGMGTFAVNHITNWAFDVLRLHRVYCKVSATNEPMVKVLAKCGYIEEGVWKDHFYFNGKHIDALLFAKISTNY